MASSYLKLKNEQVKRINRSLVERFYLLDNFKLENLLKFDISGSTGNVYRITINLTDNNIKCDCPDFARCMGLKCVCKHCCFTLLKVLKVYILGENGYLFNKLTMNSFTAFPKTLRFSEYERNFIINSYANLLTNLDEDNYNSDLVEKYLLICHSGSNSLFHNDLHDLDKRDNCPICLNEFEEKKGLINCPTCKKYIHKDCIDRWIKIKRSCPMCRSKSFLNYGDSEYINLYTSI